MAKDKRRIAQNRANKQARRKLRQKTKTSSGGGDRIAHLGVSRAELERAPVYAAFVNEALFSQGIGHAIIARKLPNGRLVTGGFLLDVYCLGVKGAFLTVQNRPEFEDFVETRFAGELKPVSAAHVRKLIDRSIAYALDLGFRPHPDFRSASVVLGGIDASECELEFRFGHDGKPFYVSGPNDSASMARSILTQLQKRCGPDGFHYLVGSPGSDDLYGDPGELDDDDDLGEDFEDDDFEDDELEPEA
ncbi:MAG: hypothetical protein RBU37_13660 [Myxococcota bacterium]|jgi:hypothetical protein|nr:hypothetical protein [Myxococcota bacterium]